MPKNIVVRSFNSDWPRIFETEATLIKEALGTNCSAIHHIGSTSVPGLAAKPIIDMIGVIKDRAKVIEPLECLGLTYKSEYNIPMRLYFLRSEGVQISLYVYEEGHPEIELKLSMFKRYSATHQVIEMHKY